MFSHRLGASTQRHLLCCHKWRVPQRNPPAVAASTSDMDDEYDEMFSRPRARQTIPNSLVNKSIVGRVLPPGSRAKSVTERKSTKTKEEMEKPTKLVWPKSGFAETGSGSVSGFSTAPPPSAKVSIPSTDVSGADKTSPSAWQKWVDAPSTAAADSTAASIIDDLTKPKSARPPKPDLVHLGQTAAAAAAEVKKEKRDAYVEILLKGRESAKPVKQTRNVDEDLTIYPSDSLGDQFMKLLKTQNLPPVVTKRYLLLKGYKQQYGYSYSTLAGVSTTDHSSPSIPEDEPDDAFDDTADVSAEDYEQENLSSVFIPMENFSPKSDRWLGEPEVAEQRANYAQKHGAGRLAARDSQLMLSMHAAGLRLASRSYLSYLLRNDQLNAGAALAGARVLNADILLDDDFDALPDEERESLVELLAGQLDRALAANNAGSQRYPPLLLQPAATVANACSPARIARAVDLLNAMNPDESAFYWGSVGAVVSGLFRLGSWQQVERIALPLLAERRAAHTVDKPVALTLCRRACHLANQGRGQRAQVLIHGYFEYLKECNEFPPVEAIDIIEKAYRAINDKLAEMGAPIYGVLRTAIGKDNRCEACQTRLQRYAPSHEMFERMRVAAKDVLLLGRNVYSNTTPQELERFSAFLNYNAELGPFDIVVDGLNLFFCTPKWTQQQKGFFIEAAIRQLMKEGFQRVLLIGRKHLQRVIRPELEIECPNISSFYVDSTSRDDPFVLYAALCSGVDTGMMTADKLLDHVAEVKRHDVAVGAAMASWISQRRVFLAAIPYYPNGHIEFCLPANHHVSAQRPENSRETWHVPFGQSKTRVDGVERGNQPDVWFCVHRRRQTTAKKDTPFVRDLMGVVDATRRRTRILSQYSDDDDMLRGGDF